MKSLLIPKLTSNDESIRVVNWLVSDKEYVKSGQTILSIETSKTNVDIESDFEGYISIHCQQADTIPVGTCYATIFDSLQDLESSSSREQSAVSSYNLQNDVSQFSNAATRYIKEHNLNPNDYLDMGLVTVEKIKAKLAARKEEITPLDKEEFPKATIEPVPFIKLAEITNLAQRKGAIISSLTVQFDTDPIRKHFLSVNWLNRRLLPYILYVFSRILSDNPKFTSYFHEKTLCLYNKVNLGLAIDLGKGLKVLVIKDAEQLPLFELQMAIVEAISAYYEDNTDVSRLQNSTVTVTDLSQDNILHFQPVLNSNQSAILGIGGDQRILGSPMTLTLVFDHRVLSGQEVAIFLNRFKERLLTEYLSLEL